ncbi:hypothetical protein M8C21_028645 [Ambrosia artemisiifolia]|uniref:Uncharacterized protein n=1 Tax=Ambrosia artemisiifolia TaxID=4212 RepID=A0AAD5C2L9_AMBAR|nr:hypothetical protein M8C21_028645 [Ambrosia artemisiifolia]
MLLIRMPHKIDVVRLAKKNIGVTVPDRGVGDMVESCISTEVSQSTNNAEEETLEHIKIKRSLGYVLVPFNDLCT